MEVSHIHQLTQEFKSSDTLDYKFDILMEISDHFRMDYREDLKRSLEENLRSKLESLVSEYEDRISRLKYTVSTLRSSNY